MLSPLESSFCRAQHLKISERLRSPSTSFQALASIDLQDMYTAVKNRLSLSSSINPMEPASKSAEQLRRRIAEAEDELKVLREQLAQLEPAEKKIEDEEVSKHIPERQSPEQRKTGAPVKPIEQAEAAAWKWPLSKEEYERYGRQLILPQVGINGTVSLSYPKSSPNPPCSYIKSVG